MHRLSADNRHRPIIRQFADNRYLPFDNRHRNRPIICFSKQNNKKLLLTAVHIDDNEVTNDSVISHVSSSTEQSKTSETMAGVLPIYDRTIVTSQSLQYDIY